MDPRETKAQLRREVAELLAELGTPARREASDNLCERLEEATMGVDGTVLAFLPLPDEIDLEPYLRKRLGTGIAVPIVDWATHDMHPGRLGGLDAADLKVGRYGLRTPVQDVPVALEDIELVLVPGLAFDRDCRRLGRGGGFYDRLLSELPGRPLTIGVCFDEQVVEVVPVESWDHVVDRVVTPTQAFTVT